MSNIEGKTYIPSKDSGGKKITTFDKLKLTSAALTIAYLGATSVPRQSHEEETAPIGPPAHVVDLPVYSIEDYYGVTLLPNTQDSVPRPLSVSPHIESNAPKNTREEVLSDLNTLNADTTAMLTVARTAINSIQEKNKENKRTGYGTRAVKKTLAEVLGQVEYERMGMGRVSSAYQAEEPLRKSAVFRPINTEITEEYVNNSQAGTIWVWGNIESEKRESSYDLVDGVHHGTLKIAGGKDKSGENYAISDNAEPLTNVIQQMGLPKAGFVMTFPKDERSTYVVTAPKAVVSAATTTETAKQPIKTVPTPVSVPTIVQENTINSQSAAMTHDVPEIIKSNEKSQSLEWLSTQFDDDSCGPTTFSNVLNYFGSHKKIKPQRVAGVLRSAGHYTNETTVRDGDGGGAIKWLEGQGYEVIQLSEAVFRQNTIDERLSIEKVREYTQKGYLIVVSGTPSYFRNQGHIFAITGVTQEGKVELADPAVGRFIDKGEPNHLIQHDLSELHEASSFAVKPKHTLEESTGLHGEKLQREVDQAPVGVNLEYWIRMTQRARANAADTGIPASVFAAQFFNESGGGLQIIGGYNGLGIKGKGPAGSVVVTTEEVVKDKKTGKKKRITIEDEFAAYETPEQLVDHYYDILMHLPNYEGVRSLIRRKVKEPHEFIVEIIKGGYATDPNYVSAIDSIIKEQNLNYLDRS